MSASVVIASNRGPVSFAADESGALTARRGGGGLVAAVAGAAGERDLLWICAALGPGDRVASRSAPGGRLDLAGHDTGNLQVRMLDIDETTFQRAYNGVANSTLWFVNHLLYDTAREPLFDDRFAREWRAYIDYNTAFAEAVADAAAPGARVLVQDYHLLLTPRLIKERRPDVRVAHFSHTPWAPADYFALLPDEVAEQVIRGVCGADHAGFLARRWAASFLECAARFVTVVGRQIYGPDGQRTNVGVHPLGVDAPALRQRARDADVAARGRVLREFTGNRQVILRIDRTELSKNIVRGLAAYRELLRSEPQWREKVVHLVFAYPSRHDLPVYREYTASVQRIVSEIDDEFATASWSPVLLEVSDDYPRSLAAYSLADVLVVNPIRDGMNLVAKEGPVLSTRGLALVLSREAGAAEELCPDAVCINPYDVTQTARALATALRMSTQERTERCERLARAAAALPPQAWLTAQLSALDDSA
ncbi:MAG: alpha,alpha-trehalose-phosphate synthase (UDP-forming) [Mycobacteriales bacterium]